MARTDILYYGGGDALTQYGALSRRLGQPKDEVVEVHTRASTARLVDRNGVMRSAASSGVPRIEWINTATDGTRDTPALLLEAERANSWSKSEDFTATAWTKTRGAATADAGTAPDGATTAEKFIPTTSDATHHISREFTGTDDTKSAFSVYAKAVDYEGVWINSLDKADSSQTTYFNLATGAVGTTATGHTVYMEAYGDSWYRLSMVYGVATGGTTPKVAWGPTETAGGEGAGFAGDGSKGILFWGAQIEQDQPFVSSYIPTTTGAVTRAADVYYERLPWKPQEMTLYVKMEERGTISTTDYSRVWHVGATGVTTDPRISLFADVSGKYRVMHDNGVTAADVTATAAPSIGDTVEVLVQLATDGTPTIKQSINSGATSSETATTAAALATSWADTRLYVNSGGTTNTGFNAVDRIRIARGVKTMAEMRAL